MYPAMVIEQGTGFRRGHHQGDGLQYSVVYHTHFMAGILTGEVPTSLALAYR